MILVAGVAVGSVALRATLPDLASFDADLRSVGTPGMQRFMMIQYALSAFNPFLAAMTPTLLAIRLRGDGPRLRRIVRQPGFVACAAATLTMLVEAVWIGSLLAVGSRFIHLTTVFDGYAQEVSFAVGGAWVALMLTGRWQPEASWIDRAGRLAGVVWIAVTVVSWSRYFLV